MCAADDATGAEKQPEYSATVANSVCAAHRAWRGVRDDLKAEPSPALGWGADELNQKGETLRRSHEQRELAHMGDDYKVGQV